MDFSLIGSGNVAHSLANAFVNAGFDPKFLLSRNSNTGESLAAKHEFQFIEDHEKLKHRGLIIIAVSDDQIMNVAKKIPFSDALLIHTSGTTSLDAVGKKRSRTGVFWPLQSFRSTRVISLKSIPVCIEGNTGLVTSALKKIADQLSGSVYVLDSEQRKKVHMAAVIANNFSNHLLKKSFDQVENAGVDREVLYPLIKATYRNALNRDPGALQTGPAVRNDTSVIDKHLKMLENDPSLQKIYRSISEKHS